MDRERRRLVHRYIDGLASLPERREVERFIAADPALAAYVRQHAAVWTQVGAMPASIADADSVAAIEALTARIHATDTARSLPITPRADARAPRTSGPLQVLPPLPRPLRARRTFDWSTALTFGITAAAVTLIALGGRGGRVGGAMTGRGGIAARVRGVNVAEAPVAVTAARGQRRMVHLPDGTDVVLGPASRMRYVPVTDGSRTVSLAGEAMFHVKHYGECHFIVRVAGATIEDLGTVFVVHAYGDAPTRVSVESGQVGLRTGSNTSATILEAGTSATVDSAGHPTVAHDAADVGDAFAWTRGTLHYRAAPLAEVTADLGRAYDLDIRLADPTLGQRVVQYTVDGDNAGAALDVLMATLAGVRYEQHGRVVTLYRR
jgi:ferric-dicitrate binding protein FerR (iron transport regulator)